MIYFLESLPGVIIEYFSVFDYWVVLSLDFLFRPAFTKTVAKAGGSAIMVFLYQASPGLKEFPETSDARLK